MPSIARAAIFSPSMEVRKSAYSARLGLQRLQRKPKVLRLARRACEWVQQRQRLQQSRHKALMWECLPGIVFYLYGWSLLAKISIAGSIEFQGPTFDTKSRAWIWLKVHLEKLILKFRSVSIVGRTEMCVLTSILSGGTPSDLSI